MSMDKAISELRALCNREIQRANQSGFRAYPGGPVNVYPVPFSRVNDLLRACDKVFAAFDASLPSAEASWIVGNGDGTKWRTWADGYSCWTDDREQATRYARRQDAEAVHAEDEDAWRVMPYSVEGGHTSAEAGAEPVAWMYELGDETVILREKLRGNTLRSKEGWTETPLFAAPPTEAAPVSQTVQDAASSNAEIVVPYGSRNGATHLRTQGDNLTFCGRDSAAWSVVDGSVTEALESSFTCKLCLNAMSTTGDPSAEAAPVMLCAKEIAASALKTACETDPADPEHPDTVMLTTGDFETIVRLAIENSCEGNPTEAAIRADEREKCLKIVQAHCCTGVDGDFYKGINSACHAIAKTIRSRGEG